MFAAMHDLVPEIVSEHVMADFNEASVAAFQQVIGSILSPVAGFTTPRLC